MIKEWINLCLAVLTAGSFYGAQAEQSNPVEPGTPEVTGALTGSYTMVTEDYDWGPGVSRVIVELDKKVSKVSGSQFSIVEEKQARNKDGSPAVSRVNRMINDAYLSSSAGEHVPGASEYITIEMDAAPQVGNPFFFAEEESHYIWADPYRLAIDLKPGKVLKTEDREYHHLAIDREPAKNIMPQADLFQTGMCTIRNNSYSYAHYIPHQDGRKHPLVVWLHGLGEGGTDPTVTLLGGRAAAWAQEDIQESLGGAYVLVPQCPTMWVDEGGGVSSHDGGNRYTKSLMEMIHWYVKSQPNIDTHRIYVGGCSNGGYMTLALLLEEPDFFAAGFPVCGAYLDEWLDEGEIKTLSRIPLWFVHSELDQICPPDKTTFPTVERLKAAGARNLHLSRLGSIVDRTGLIPNGGIPYIYNPHYAWVPVLNCECRDNVTGESMFHWLAAQRNA